MISVAIQGGAMRSIYCVGAVRALVESGYHEQVRSIHVASAGCVAACVLAGSVIGDGNERTIPQITEDLLTRLGGRRFIDQHRVQRMVDVDYLVRVMREETSISADQLCRAGVKFEVVITDAATGAARYIDLSTCTSEASVVDALRGTMAIPVLYPPKALVDGRRCFDGGIADPLPVIRAIQERPRLVVAISSVAADELAAPAEGREANIIRFAPGIPPLVRHLMLVRNPLADATESLMRAGDVCGIPIVRIVPSRPELLGHRLETDTRRLLDLEQLGYEDGMVAIKEARDALETIAG